MKPHLLIAYGNESVTERLESYFLRHGYEVSVAIDGLECTSLLERITPNLIILDSDLSWRGADGILARLRQIFSDSPIPVLLLADALSDRVDASPPVVRCLQRPFDVTLLNSTVESILIDMKRSTEANHHA